MENQNHKTENTGGATRLRVAVDLAAVDIEELRTLSREAAWQGFGTAEYGGRHFFCELTHELVGEQLRRTRSDAPLLESKAAEALELPAPPVECVAAILAGLRKIEKDVHVREGAAGLAIVRAVLAVLELREKAAEVQAEIFGEATQATESGRGAAGEN